MPLVSSSMAQRYEHYLDESNRPMIPGLPVSFCSGASLKTSVAFFTWKAEMNVWGNVLHSSGPRENGAPL